MMTLSVFMNSDCLSDYLSGLLLPVSPIGGSGVAAFVYVIATCGTYLVGIGVMTSNRQVLR